MRLRRSRKVEAELLELVRGELATIRTEVQTTLTDTAAALSTRVRTELEQRMGEPRALASGIQNVRQTIVARDAELAQVLRRVVDTCDALVERLQIDRLERTALVDTLGRLTNALAAAASSLPPNPVPGRTVIGGTVDPAVTATGAASVADAGTGHLDAPATGDELEIDLEALAPEPTPLAGPPASRPVRPDGVEVRCRFGDRWVTGFEVCEVVPGEEAARYRLRRRSDGSVIPTLFDEKDLRFFSTAFVEPR